MLIISQAYDSTSEHRCSLDSCKYSELEGVALRNTNINVVHLKVQEDGIKTHSR